MPAIRLPRHDELTAASRLEWVRVGPETASFRELLLLFLAGGAAAAASTMLDFSLKIPGHAILRAVFPMAAGLALVPRRGAGAAMGLAAAVTLVGFRATGLTGHGIGTGAMTSLLATGPMLDLALWKARAGWRLWLGFALAGMGANVLAFLVRGSGKIHQGGGPKLFGWLHVAPMTYLLCGLVAGLASGMIWFAFRSTPRGKGEAIAAHNDGASR